MASTMRKPRPFRLARGHHGLAMVEIIIAIGVLAVVSMFVVEMFVRATNLEHKARDLDHACAAAETAIEEARVLGRVPGTQYFDAHWRPTAAEDDRGYTLTVDEYSMEGRTVVDITVTRNAPYLLETESPAILFVLTGAIPK